MIYGLFSVRDLKSDFWTPRIAVNSDSAKRDFAMMVNTPENIVSFAPSDFELYYVGDFDTKTGKLMPIEFPEFVCNATDLVGAK